MNSWSASYVLDPRPRGSRARLRPLLGVLAGVLLAACDSTAPVPSNVPITNVPAASASLAPGETRVPGQSAGPSGPAVMMPAGVQYDGASETLPQETSWFGHTVIYANDGKPAFILGGRGAARRTYLASQGHGPDTRDSARLGIRNPDGSWTDTLIDDGGSVKSPPGYVLNHGAWAMDIASGSKGTVAIGYIPFWTDGNGTGTSVGLSWFSVDERTWRRTDLRTVVGAANSFLPRAVTALADGSFVMTGMLSSRDMKRASTVLTLRSTDGQTWAKGAAIQAHWALESSDITSFGSTLIMTGVENACDSHAYGLLTFSTGQQFRLWTSTDEGASWQAQDRTAGGVIVAAEPVPTSAKDCPTSGAGGYLATLNERFASSGSFMGVVNGRAYFSNGERVSSTVDFTSWAIGSVPGITASGLTPGATVAPARAARLIRDGEAVVLLSLQPRRNADDLQVPDAGYQVLSWRSTDGGGTWLRLPMARPLILHDRETFGQSPDGSVWLFDVQTSYLGLEKDVLSIRSSVAGTLAAWGTCAPAAGADCAFTTLSGLSLAGADLTGIDLAGAIITKSDLSSAILTGADLQYANLEATLTGADLSTANAYRARIRGDLSGAKVDGASFLAATIDPSFFAASGVTSSTIIQAHISIGASTALHGFDFGAMDLTAVSFTGSSSALSDMTGADFTDATLLNTDFYQVDLTGAKFRPAKPGDLANQVSFLGKITCPDGQAVDPDTAGFESCRIKVPTK